MRIVAATPEADFHPVGTDRRAVPLFPDWYGIHPGPSAFSAKYSPTRCGERVTARPAVTPYLPAFASAVPHGRQPSRRPEQGRVVTAFPSMKRVCG